MLRELAELREKIRSALAANNFTAVVKLVARYLEAHDQCYPHH